MISLDMAAEYLGTMGSLHLNDPIASSLLIGDPAMVTAVYRVAAKRLHPDAGGSVEKFQRLQEAKRVLDVHHST